MPGIRTTPPSALEVHQCIDSSPCEAVTPPCTGCPSAPPEGSPEGGPREGGPMLDTSTPRNDHSVVLRAVGQRIGLLKNRRVWSRVYLGMTLPGRYYFLTMTSSPSSPPIHRSWRRLLRWLRRNYPGIAHIHVLTDEGCGVAHIVVRLTYQTRNIDVRLLRSYWQRSHGATQLRIERVKDRDRLTRYLSEQAKKTLAGELRHQPAITSWRYTRNWLPRGFTRAWGRFYQRHAGTISQDTIARVTADWLRACARRPEEVEDLPTVTAG